MMKHMKDNYMFIKEMYNLYLILIRNTCTYIYYH